MKKVSDLVAGMSTAAQKQAAGIDQVSQTILQIEPVTQHNAALVEQTAATSGVMDVQAQKLKNLMGFFSLRFVSK
ncbi:MAG TPA: hypothetical protein PLD30_17330 [Candidatus Competibacteraceae bacterium]|nr:hypothetical protein [Candidatus Competibacter sp.]MDG4606377.1 hypothetical protein [Candidatus Contendobacter sp.]HRD49814.1 hypothetical protein [Candidatus Contendobacter sp.]HRF45965.1 hypothetical protein [Candidatus Competibacteraceae bacterium]